MNLIGFTLVACILLAMACPLNACGKCQGSCERPSCYNVQAEKGQETRYFPDKINADVTHIHREAPARGNFTSGKGVQGML
uniref:Putative secreted protein n=1 Tax=Amblyomma cajennense TaxID=34607 RepID=A0A023FDG6_AMBCJ